MIRLPGALFGILAIPFAYLAGRLAGGRRLGLFFALLLALCPMHIQTSREAYFYSPMLPGSVMLVWGLLYAWRYRRRPQPFPARFYVITCLGFLLTAYSHLTGWWLCALVVPMTLAILAKRSVRTPDVQQPTANTQPHHAPSRATRSTAARGQPETPAPLHVFRWREVLGLLAICLLIGLPLLLEDWAVPYFYRDLTDPAIRANTVRVMGGRNEPVLEVLGSFASGLAWGRSGLRTGFLLLALVLAAANAIGAARRRPVWLLVAVLLAAGTALCILGNRLTATRLNPRYMTAFLPAYLLFIAGGLWRVSAVSRVFCRTALRAVHDRATQWRATEIGCCRTAKRRATAGCATQWRTTVKARRIAAWLLSAAAVALLAGPAWWSTQMTGQPHPYKQIIAETNKLPPGTPVLVDRWFEPWNELRVHSSTNVFFTFTVPNEPPDLFERVNWRATATNFLTRFPDAAYLEIRQSYADLFGPWDWPKRHFRRRIEFRDLASEKLDAIGLALRGFSRPLLFYNTREDAVEVAREGGASFLVWYGPGWGYHKLWPQVQDFRDWRVLRNEAVLELFNLAEGPRKVSLRIRGVAVNGAKKVSLRAEDGGIQTTDPGEATSRVFPSGQIVDWTVPGLILPPGSKKLVLADAAWGQRSAVLLVEEAEIKPES